MTVGFMIFLFKILNKNFQSFYDQQKNIFLHCVHRNRRNEPIHGVIGNEFRFQQTNKTIFHLSSWVKLKKATIIHS